MRNRETEERKRKEKAREKEDKEGEETFQSRKGNISFKAI